MRNKSQALPNKSRHRDYSSQPQGKHCRGMIKNLSVPLLPLILIFTIFLASTPSWAQVAGFRLTTPTITNQGPGSAEAEFDMIAYGHTSPAPGSYAAGTPIAGTSSIIFTNTYDFGNGPGPYNVRLFVNSLWNTAGEPALDYGDGNILQTAILPLDVISRPSFGSKGQPTNLFRATFSHTYNNGNYQLRGRLTPQGEYGNMNPGVNADLPLSTGVTNLGTLVNTFIYAYTISPVGSPPNPTTRTSQRTATNTFTNTVVSVTQTLPLEINENPPSLAIEGSCPGNVSLRISGATPGARISLWSASALGTFSIPGGPCAGVDIGLDTDDPSRAGFANQNGDLTWTRILLPNQCGWFFRAVDHGNCSKSDITVP